MGITKEIWEDRGIATLHEYYGEDMTEAAGVISWQPWSHCKHHGYLGGVS